MVFLSKYSINFSLGNFSMKRDLFAKEALNQIPKILTLLDRNPHSPTYGCFDRNFWQYKIIDFPSGMAQEFVYPLALAYHTDLPDNPFYQQPILKEWVEAGILYGIKSAHKDSSCDDYFPFERAAGATAFSLLAFIESYAILGLNNPNIIRFLRKRGDWLAFHQESGRLTNHQALITLCLELLFQLLQTDRWKEAKEQRLDQVLDWQNPEGWFQEYEGCDPGYHTLTISCLARIYEFNPDNNRLKDALAKAVILASHFIHPDGSYGGEYSSRNTYNFFPHGFELVGQWLPEALSINDHFLEGLANGLAPCYSDDHIIGHHTWNYLLAWRDFVLEDRPETKPRPTERLWLEEGKILIDRRDDVEVYIGLNKGGVFKLFREGKLIDSDTNFSLQIKQGNQIKNAVAHLIGNYDIKVEENDITVSGQLGWAKQNQMTTLKLIILRLVMFFYGRFYPNKIRKILQKMLITNKEKAPFTFSRKFQWEDGQWQITDQLEAKSWDNIINAKIGCDQTSIYVVMSRTFQLGQLQPWLDITEQIKQLEPDQPLILERKL
jgi:hypothetical protein